MAKCLIPTKAQCQARSSFSEGAKVYAESGWASLPSPNGLCGVLIWLAQMTGVVGQLAQQPRPGAEPGLILSIPQNKQLFRSLSK